MSPKSVVAALCSLAGTAAALDGYKNVLGGELQRCSGPGSALTGYTRNGHCIDRDDDGGSHHICIDMTSTSGGNFCAVTGQSNWCSSSMRCDGSGGLCPVENWCVCQWAFAKYMRLAGGCDRIQDIVCEAVNEEALKAYQKSTQHTEAYNCLVSRCKLKGASSKAAAASTKEEDLQQSVQGRVKPLPSNGGAAAVTPDKPATQGNIAADEGTSSAGAVAGAIAGALGCLAISGGLALVALSRKRAAQSCSDVGEQELSQPLPQADATPEGSFCDSALTPA